MPSAAMSLAKGVVLEDLGDEMLAWVPGNGQAIKFGGELARAVRLVRDGEPENLAPGQMRQLKDHGILCGAKSLSRRSLVRSSAFGFGAGVVVLAIPTVAAASSAGEVRLGTWGWYDANPSGFLREFAYTWPDGTGPGDDAEDEKPTAMVVATVGTTGLGSTEGRVTRWGIETPGQGAPLNGDLVGTFSFDGTDYEVRFEFTPAG